MPARTFRGNFVAMVDAERDAAHILVVDDDDAVLDMIALTMEDAGFRVSTAGDGQVAWQAFLAECPDLVIAHLLMPQVDGLELCRRIRQDHATPIVIVTSRNEEMDEIVGFEHGADDYISKPFSNRVLLARVRSLLRRTNTPATDSSEKRQAGDLQLDRNRREALYNATQLSLTVTEFDLLFVLLGLEGEVLTRDTLINEVYGLDVVVSDRTIYTFVKRLRRKLRDAGADPDPIETVRGVGYRYLVR